MSDLGHHFVFWATGMLAGSLLGWMLARRRVGLTGSQDPRLPGAVSLAVQEPPRLQSLGARRSA